MSPSLSLDFGRKEMGNVGDGEIFTRTISKFRRMGSTFVRSKTVLIP